MTKNKKTFLINLLGSVIIFLMGIIYISLPTYYGIETMENLDINGLFISFTIIYATVNLGLFLTLGKNPNNESIYLCIAGSTAGLLNIILTNYIAKSFSISLAIFILMVTAIKIFTIDYYYDHKDAYYYIEILCLIIFFLVGIMTSINILGTTMLKSIMLGFLIIIMGILRMFNISIKAMLKSKRFLKKIKLK